MREEIIKDIINYMIDTIVLVCIILLMFVIVRG
jgi:hypothetical protein